MNEAEAQRILQRKIQELRAKRYEELQKLLGAEKVLTTVVQSGTVYRLEVQAVLDDRFHKALRVIVAIDDGKGWRQPLRDSFIVAVDGSFLGE